ncbi:hypothetical protein LTR10_006727 [Elasticomyces elasticus]|nr:hypothetical protein LTR10_006727 [Elasticomyces elasticus]
MAAGMRDTQFGKLVRLSTGRRRLRYPDEIDLSMWTASMEHSTTSRKQDESVIELQHQHVDGEGREKPALLVSWYGSNDVEICLLDFAFYIASSIYTPGEQAVMEDFGVSEIEATLGLSLFTLGYGLGPMLWSPLSEIPSVGRNDIYFFTSLAFVLPLHVLAASCGTVLRSHQSSSTLWTVRRQEVRQAREK